MKCTASTISDRSTLPTSNGAQRPQQARPASAQGRQRRGCCRRGPLGGVAVQVAGRDMDLRALDRPLEQAPVVLDAVRVNDAADVLALGVIDLLHSEVLFQAFVGLVRVREHRRHSKEPLDVDRFAGEDEIGQVRIQRV